MKNLVKNIRGKAMLCALCLGVTSFLFDGPWSSFIFLGEPEVPEALKED